MNPSTTVQNMLANKRIVVPAYQRAYSWETPNPTSTRTTQTDVFLSDLEDYRTSSARSPYYFGHFLFEEKDGKYQVIDGQQRLTTLTLFLSALFKCLKALRPLSETEQACFADVIRTPHVIRFNTVDYDNRVFIDYVIDQVKIDHGGLSTSSSLRIVNAFDYFNDQLKHKPEAYLCRMLDIVCQAACTTHRVQDEAEAIQMFIFQNNRGKRPSNLEVVKAQFMYAVHLRGQDDDHKEMLISEIKDRFEQIYKSIASIDYRIKEDDVLLYTLRVQFNSLWESDSLDKIDKLLGQPDSLIFIREFTQALAASFLHLCNFFVAHEKKHFAIHSLVTLGGIGIVLPFIIKAYNFKLPMPEIESLCEAFEGLIVRHRLIGTRADITSRISHVYERFTAQNPQIEPIVARINQLKIAEDPWTAYWNNENLRVALNRDIHHATAKHLLWKYENHLNSGGQQGYNPRRYDAIEKPELEHIAPTTEPKTKPHGYGKYDDTFVSEYLNCLGNYLLLSKPHNCSVGNIAFSKKLLSYTYLTQQREIAELCGDKPLWGKRAIDRRHERIVEVLMEQL